ncbi:MAG: GFA family protein, partial [Sphingomonadales bacterium]
GWALVGNDEIEIKGTAKIYASSEHGRRHFCADCGTGLFYSNDAIFPGQIDVQTATLDDPDAIPAQAQIQTAERIGWMEKLNDLPAFERYPPFE